VKDSETHSVLTKTKYGLITKIDCELFIRKVDSKSAFIFIRYTHVTSGLHFTSAKSAAQCYINRIFLWGPAEDNKLQCTNNHKYKLITE